jgi:Homeodomain-like domain-containing protein
MAPSRLIVAEKPNLFASHTPLVESRYVSRVYFSPRLIKSYWWPQLVAALILQHQRSIDRTGGRTIGGIMLRRGQTTTFQERLEITERAAAGQSDPEIAATLGCSVWTVRKWRRRGQHQGRIGLSSQMGRPTTGLLSTFHTGMRDAIVQMRRMHPGWGPTTLLAELRVNPSWAERPLPSRSRIAALLKAEKLTRDYQRHSDLPSPPVQPQGAPHDVWELDAASAACMWREWAMSVSSPLSTLLAASRSKVIRVWRRPIRLSPPIN